MSTLKIAQPAQVAAASGPRRIIARRPLAAYFILAFSGSWGVQLPLLLSRDGLGLLPYTLPLLPFALLFLLSTYAGPTLAALVVTAAAEGRTGVRHFLRRYTHLRVGMRWYFLAVLGYPLLYLLAATAVLGTAPLQALTARWTLLFTLYLPNLLLFQGLTQWAEEPGWRGFALPRLQQRFGATPGSLILGLLHGLWHLPVFMYVGGIVALGPFDLATFALNTAAIMIVTLSWTWIYNKSGGSIPIAVLVHSSFNAAGPLVDQLIPGIPGAANRVLQVAPIVVSLLILVCTRGRLAYRPDPPSRTEAKAEAGAI